MKNLYFNVYFIILFTKDIFYLYSINIVKFKKKFLPGAIIASLVEEIEEVEEASVILVLLNELYNCKSLLFYIGHTTININPLLLWKNEKFE